MRIIGGFPSSFLLSFPFFIADGFVCNHILNCFTLPLCASERRRKRRTVCTLFLFLSFSPSLYLYPLSIPLDLSHNRSFLVSSCTHIFSFRLCECRFPSHFLFCSKFSSSLFPLNGFDFSIL